MPESGWTKGPLVCAVDYRPFVGTSYTVYRDAGVQPHVGYFFREEDAKLLAAAPAMAEAHERIADGLERQVPVTRAYLIDNGIDPNFADVLLSHYLDFARDARSAPSQARGEPGDKP